MLSRTPSNRNTAPRFPVIAGVWVLVFALTLLATMASFFLPDFFHAAVGGFALLIVLLPVLVEKQYDFFSPWTFIAISVAIGTTIRSVYIALGYPDDPTVRDMWTLNEPVEYFYWPAFVMLLGLTCLVLGYLSVKHKRHRPPGTSRVWRTRRLLLTGLTTALVALWATFVFYQETGGFESNKLSAKRTIHEMEEVVGSSENHSHGILRELANLANLGQLLLLAAFLQRRAPTRPIELGLWALLFLISSLLPFYSSSRTGQGLPFIYNAALLYYANRKISLPKVCAIAFAFALGGCVVMALTCLRADREIKVFSPLTILDSVCVNRNFAGYSKSAHIINSVPKELEWKYGETIYVWLFAPIPRSMWANKPFIQSGPIIGREVYGFARTGIPPGLISELFWNFHLPGVVIGCFLCGMLLHKIYLRVGPVRGGDLSRAAVYIYAVMMIGHQMMGNGLGAAVFSMTIHACVASMLARFTSTPVKQNKRRLVPMGHVLHAHRVPMVSR